MACPPPRAPDNNYPPDVKPKVLIPTSALDEANMRKDELSTQVLMKLIITALKILGNRNGSSIADIRRVLASEGYSASAVEIRKAIILAMKEGKIKRPTSAVKNGIYGLYVLVEDDVPPRRRKHSRANIKRCCTRSAYVRHRSATGARDMVENQDYFM